jgi:hypothetical protein
MTRAGQGQGRVKQSDQHQRLIKRANGRVTQGRAERREKRIQREQIGHGMRAGQCRGSKRVEQSHGGAGGAEGEDRAAAPYKGKQNSKQGRGGGGGKGGRSRITEHRQSRGDRT